jgi:hypothetical protein
LSVLGSQFSVLKYTKNLGVEFENLEIWSRNIGNKILGFFNSCIRGKKNYKINVLLINAGTLTILRISF